MKSKIDQRSPSRFSIGVPVSAMRASARSCLTARVCLAAGILDGLRLVEHRPAATASAASQGDAGQKAVARDDEIGVARGRPRRPLFSFSAGMRRGMDDERLQARREARDLRRPVGEQRGRRHQQRRLALARPLLLQHQQQRQDLDGLAEPHVVGEAGAEPEPGEQMEPLHAGLLIGPQRRLQRAAGIGAREPVRAAQAPPASRASQGPATVWLQSTSASAGGLVPGNRRRRPAGAWPRRTTARRRRRAARSPRIARASGSAARDRSRPICRG